MKAGSDMEVSTGRICLLIALSLSLILDSPEIVHRVCIRFKDYLKDTKPEVRAQRDPNKLGPGEPPIQTCKQPMLSNTLAR